MSNNWPLISQSAHSPEDRPGILVQDRSGQRSPRERPHQGRACPYRHRSDTERAHAPAAGAAPRYRQASGLGTAALRADDWGNIEIDQDLRTRDASPHVGHIRVLLPTVARPIAERLQPARPTRSCPPHKAQRPKCGRAPAPADHARQASSQERYNRLDIRNGKPGGQPSDPIAEGIRQDGHHQDADIVRAGGATPPRRAISSSVSASDCAAGRPARRRLRRDLTPALARRASRSAPAAGHPYTG